jgi:hypothetical protein
MAGGGYSKRGPGVPLGERATGSRSTSNGEVVATACWLEPPARLPGAVLAWRRDPESGWQALVAAWVPADDVHPRSP